MVTILLIFAGSILAGIWGALLGLGGGLILIPMLTLVFKIPIHIAIGASIVGVIATSTGTAITYVREGIADIRLGMTLELATTVGAIVGALLAGLFKPDLLYILFALLLVYITFSMARKKEVAVAIDEGVARKYKKMPLGMVASGLAGVMSGLLGIGGGIIKIPAMYIIMEVPLPVAIATSNFMIGVTATASAFIYFNRGDIHPLVAAPAAIGIFAGALLGTKISPKLSREFLRWLFIAVASYTAVQMLIKGLHLKVTFFGG